MSIITLTTDFGTKDWFVGTMKGVIASINPKATIIDISHDAPEFNIAAGAFILKNAYSYFPKGTIHCVVVDPGVGSQREAIVIQTDDYFFVGPNNGVLSYVLEESPAVRAVKITDSQFIAKTVSQTFHGRDIFSPISAQLSLHTPMEKLGTPIRNFKRLDQKNSDRINIIFIDKFGNIILNKKELKSVASGTPLTLLLDDKQYDISVVLNYSEGKKGELLLLKGSSGHLEIAINQQNAAAVLNTSLKNKQTIQLKIKK